MNPPSLRPRGFLTGSPDRLPTVPVQWARQLWLLAMSVIVAGLLAVLAGPAPAHGSAWPSGEIALSTLDGQPPAPGEQHLHLSGVAESDGESGRIGRPAAASHAGWPARHAARLLPPRLPAPAPVGTTERAYRSPPAHAPPCARHG